MKLWPKTYSLTSEKNGIITVREWLGRASVRVGGYEESGYYLIPLIRSGLRKIPRTSVQNILLLGLAGGTMVREIEYIFPKASVTVVEWDPVMVQVAKNIRPWKKEPEICVGDMFEVVPRLEQEKREFDLVIVDVFFGGVPDGRLADQEHLSSVAKVLAPEGFLFVNLFESVSFIPAFEVHMRLVDTWKIDYNNLALFSKK